ncbi:MAG TPA: hypothetical protein VII55_02145 [Candidatus Saccharimonadales bacterium]
MAGGPESVKDKNDETSADDSAAPAEYQGGAHAGWSLEERGIILGYLIRDLFESAGYHDQGPGQSFVETPGGNLSMN